MHNSIYACVYARVTFNLDFTLAITLLKTIIQIALEMCALITNKLSVYVRLEKTIAHRW